MSTEPFTHRFTALVLQITVAASYGGILAVLLLSTTDFTFISLEQAYPFPYNILMMILYALVGLGVVFLLNLVFRFTSLRPDRLFMTLLLSPLLLLATVLVGHILLLFFFRGIPSFFLYSLVSFASLFFTMFAILFLILDMLPKWGKQIMVVWYGGSIGAFLGVSIPTIPLFVLFLALATIDFFTARTVQPDWQERAESADFLGTMIKGTFMGVGDIVAYAAIAAHSLAYFSYFGGIIAIISTLMLFVGAAVLVWRYSKRIDKPIPGLLVILFGVLPWLPFLLLPG